MSSRSPRCWSRDGYIGIKDFEAIIIRAYEAAGWIGRRRRASTKTPAARQPVTSGKGADVCAAHKRQLLVSRSALAGLHSQLPRSCTNPTPIQPDVSNEEWIQVGARGGTPIEEGDTLQYTTARDAEDSATSARCNWQ